MPIHVDPDLQPCILERGSEVADICFLWNKQNVDFCLHDKKGLLQVAKYIDPRV